MSSSNLNLDAFALMLGSFVFTITYRRYQAHQEYKTSRKNRRKDRQVTLSVRPPGVSMLPLDVIANPASNSQQSLNDAVVIENFGEYYDNAISNKQPVQPQLTDEEDYQQTMQKFLSISKQKNALNGSAQSIMSNSTTSNSSSNQMKTLLSTSKYAEVVKSLESSSPKSSTARMRTWAL